MRCACMAKCPLVVAAGLVLRATPAWSSTHLVHKLQLLRHRVMVVVRWPRATCGADRQRRGVLNWASCAAASAAPRTLPATCARAGCWHSAGTHEC